MGFEMKIPRLNKKNIMINPYASKAATNALLEASSDQQVLYTSEAVEQLADSLNTLIQLTQAAYDAIADSIRFLTFSLENSEIQNTSLLQKISTLDDSLVQHQNQKLVNIVNYNKSSLSVSRSLRYLYEGDYNKALTAIDKAIELNPNLAIAYARKGSIYVHLGQIKNASINYNIALKLDPEFDEVREILQALKTDQLKSADLEEKE
jgi:tetratricopeptide (TPR) repeat protein